MFVVPLFLLLLTLIAYGVYRFMHPDKPPHHGRFILGAIAAGIAVTWCDVPDAVGMDGGVTMVFRLIRMGELAVFAGACYGGYKIIQMAPERRHVPLAWVIGLYLIVYLGWIGHGFYAEAAAVHCDNPAATGVKDEDKPGKGRAALKDPATASLMYQRICEKDQNDIRAGLARMFHRWGAAPPTK